MILIIIDTFFILGILTLSFDLLVNLKVRWIVAPLLILTYLVIRNLVI